ncbi:gloB, partial [Acrasis kona]
MIITGRRTNLRSAEKVLITDVDGKYHVRNVKRIVIDEPVYCGSTADEENTLKTEVEHFTFEFRNLRYLYDVEEDNYFVQHMDPYDILSDHSTKKMIGLSHPEHLMRLTRFGSNHIDVKKSNPFRNLFKQMRKPIYWFLITVFILRLTREISGQGNFYPPLYIYSVLFALFIVISFIFNVLRANHSKKLVKQLIKTYGPEVRVIRDSESYIVGSASLVPGDLVQITGRITLPCDLVLIEGTMDVDECTITGDTVPGSKAPYIHTEKNPGVAPLSIQQENMLIGGTRVISAKNALAVVVRTGFNTSRGRTIRTLLSQEEEEQVHSYSSDINNLMITLMLSAAVNTLVAGIFRYHYLHKTDWTALRYLNQFVSTVPPFLTLVLILPMMVARRTLSRLRIKCTSLLGLLKMGTVDCICYDKTGTMTEEILTLHGVLQVDSNTSFQSIITHNHSDAVNSNVTTIMAACHDLTKIHNRVVGDKLEEALFVATGFELKRELNENKFSVHPRVARSSCVTSSIHVSQIYCFNTILGRMSVVTQECVFS